MIALSTVDERVMDHTCEDEGVTNAVMKTKAPRLMDEIRSSRTCWRQATTCVLSRNCCGTRTKDVATTQIYTHVLNRGGRGVLSPLDADSQQRSAGT